MSSSENADIVTEPSQKQEIPTVPDNAEHHVITPVGCLSMLNMFQSLLIDRDMSFGDEGI